jgi:hypothetical protein
MIGEIGALGGSILPNLLGQRSWAAMKSRQIKFQQKFRFSAVPQDLAGFD